MGGVPLAGDDRSLGACGVRAGAVVHCAWARDAAVELAAAKRLAAKRQAAEAQKTAEVKRQQPPPASDLAPEDEDPLAAKRAEIAAKVSSATAVHSSRWLS